MNEVPSLKPPHRVRIQSGEWRTEAAKFRPWWRKAWDWFMVAHRVLTTCAAMCAATIAIHGYIKALEVKDIVRAAVVEVVHETNAVRDARLEVLETQTAGLPDWRGETTKQDVDQTRRLTELERRASSCEQQMLILFQLRGR